jgi:hypothetical protein
MSCALWSTVCMGNIALRLAHFATLALCGLGLINAALASPPIARGALPINHGAALHLDLRAPVAAAEPAERVSMSFHSSSPRQTLGAQTRFQLPAFGAEAAPGRVPGRVEEFAQRVHREGLPVARVWENKSALVSLGLNQKGKPGLWIIQKIR